MLARDNAASSASSPLAAASNHPPPDTGSGGRKKRNRHKKRRNRRQSFATPLDIAGTDALSPEVDPGENLLAAPSLSAARSSFYRLGQAAGAGGILSTTSIESSALLDHRHQQPMPVRRPSTLGQFGRGPSYPSRASQGHTHDGTSSAYRLPLGSSFGPGGSQEHLRRSRYLRAHDSSGGESDDGEVITDKTPLVPPQTGHTQGPRASGGSQRYGALATGDEENTGGTRYRRKSNATSNSSHHLKSLRATTQNPWGGQGEYNVNYPPSVPGSPKQEPDRSMGFDDVMLTENFSPSRSPERRWGRGSVVLDSVIDMTGEAGMDPYCADSTPPSPSGEDRGDRRHPVAEEDVCFPVEGMSEIADDESPPMPGGSYRISGRRRRLRRWPDLEVLEEWSREEKEQRSEGIRAKKISEPVLVGGRLRPSLKAGWHRLEEDAPYRFTYFNEEFAGTIHSQTISELLQPGQTFRELFIPDLPVLSDDSSDDEGGEPPHQDSPLAQQKPFVGTGDLNAGASIVGEQPLVATPGPMSPPEQKQEKPPKPKRYGARPTFWLDVLSPTEAEMKVISKAFAIHPLTSEDIMMQEAREKVELFRNYYFVNYRTFDQDTNSEHYLEPINMYVVVFREGVISFHFSLTPHPANVRRRIRQLKDYLILSGDWISYAIIDDITDVFVPLIQSVEEEVDDIDDVILQLHSSSDPTQKEAKENEMKSEFGAGESGGGMLRRVGDCRKKVMGLYRLLGNKADVIKGFAKRCNEQWEVAPRSEIGLYLGDIQDHIITMTSNLSHYEKILSRSHSNYLAQINIRMNERQEQTADVLGRLTVLGTIVLPMNIITGLWGMNVLVPGQDIDNLNWFWSITVGLLCFGFLCYSLAKKVYKIV
ncbi:MAG: CorA metal ion transporter [Geoglossum umbratile]|nr:MAG: CorA metal ion transporter [Geoglossum umbratile]